jgi:glycosyltransferase involved in cell wall biosynthesis
LVKDGHEVVIFSSQPSYKTNYTIERQASVEEMNGMIIHRITLLPEGKGRIVYRLLNMIYFPLRIFFFILFEKRFDRVMVSTVPQVIGGLFTALGACFRHSDFFYHCMDIHPEVGRVSGEFSNPLVFRLLQWLDGITCRMALKVIVLSGDMRKSLLERNDGGENIEVINNFSMPVDEGRCSDIAELLKKEGRFRILFAGNIGRFQGLEPFVDAMKLLSRRSEIELVFLGEGSALASLKRRSRGMNNIFFFPHQSSSTARQVMADADLGIVSLEKKVYKYAFPSKTMTYLSAGCPLLVSVESGSQLVNFVRSTGVGICVESKDPALIAGIIERLCNDKTLHQKMKKSTLRVADEMFSEKVILRKWSLLMSKIGDCVG